MCYTPAVAAVRRDGLFINGTSKRLKELQNASYPSKSLPIMNVFEIQHIDKSFLCTFVRFQFKSGCFFRQFSHNNGHTLTIRLNLQSEDP